MACTAPKLDKAAIRKMMIRRRNDLTAEEVTELSRRIEENLFSCDEFLSRERILYHLSFEKEVNTDSMIERSLKLQKKVYVPRINKSAKKMEICQIKSLDADMKLNDFGIREPVHAAVESPGKIDAVVTPGLAFDRSGGRVGFGGGYYDKLFAELPQSSLLIGIAYGFQIMDSLSQDSWDRKVQKVVTEKDTLSS
ncbi:MAG: 5-formyltetrahydrofolate cyclo-ligase [Nitrospinae bacterium]|nr:5-formyltetrahydrofolate cyclo-ligase [Nitrospinota bacterium]MZH04943.1 5-formyltetrahydrofolate cyclo-ligase [Nitrospinota bacterium]MZH13542.1 5-formyltetrahydrofolate cyclo-ligase [Nitrospinota bacterium]